VRPPVGGPVQVDLSVTAGGPRPAGAHGHAGPGRAVSALRVPAIRIFLAREGHVLGVERTHRLWRAAGLQVPRKRPRRRVAASRPRPRPPQGRNHVWAYDFVFDHCANGQRLKRLTVVDEFRCECLAIDVAGSIRSPRVIEVLSVFRSMGPGVFKSMGPPRAAPLT